VQQTEQSINAPRNVQLAPPPVLTVRGKPVRPWVALAAVLMGFFMAILDTTIVNIAIPSIQTSLKADLTSLSWVLNAYNLVYAVLLVTAGRFADQYGRKRLFMLGMILFSLGSLGCALAPAFGQSSGMPAMSWLIGFRALQGLGAATLVPVSLAMILVIFPPEKRGAAIGAWEALAGLAAAIGPVIGGFLDGGDLLPGAGYHRRKRLELDL
jgi:MFS family permease